MGRGTSSIQVPVPKKVLRSLRWWRSLALSHGCLFFEPQRVVVKTDASLHGWGSHCQGQVAQGTWTDSKARRPVNWLELRAIFLALWAFHQLISGFHVLVLMDNVTAKAHTNCLGGTRSQSLMLEAMRLGLWVERHLSSLKAEHISSVANVQADWLSCQHLDHVEWHLHPQIFRELVAHFGTPEVDLFATQANAKLPRFFTW